MKLTLNPYALVIEADGTTNFFLNDHTNPVKIILDQNQAMVLSRMNEQEFFEYEELCKVFDASFVNALIKNGCFIATTIDTVSSNSRTDAFLATHDMPDAREKLNRSKVLVLGAGGIGTHMAWHMVALGIKKLTIVDFDTVEESNFNRQLLFDHCDIGKVKVDVLKEKLSAINPSVEIEAVCTRVSSEDELEKLCLSDEFDLIIKALDSPSEFPVWLDNLARKHQLTYISGITMRENVLVGPSYIPCDDACGWSELINLDYKNSRKVYGTAPSLGIMLYHISDELAVEAFKILTGYGSLKYKNKVVCRNIFTNQEQVFEKTKVENKVEENKSFGTLFMSLILMITLAVAGISQSWFWFAGGVAAIIMPFFMYKTQSNVMKSTFLNSTILSLGLLVKVIQWVSISSIASLISSCVLMFGIHSAITLLLCVFNFIIYKLTHKK